MCRLIVREHARSDVSLHIRMSKTFHSLVRVSVTVQTMESTR